MSKALSLDLRQRVVAAVRDEGLSHRVAAARFKVIAASISRSRALERQAGDLRPGLLGGDRRSGAIEAHAETILRLFNARRDMTIEEHCTAIWPAGACTSAMGGARSGSRARSISTPTGRCSWTKAGPAPT